MSLLTLESNEDPAIIRNNFSEGVLLAKGTEVGLVSLSINKIAAFEIVTGVNDTFLWRIGGITQYLQHTVVIPAGEYTGFGLATEMVKQLNNSTILGNYKGAWTVNFDNTKFENDGAFTIDYGQNEVPDFNDNTLSQYAGTAGLSFNGNGTEEIEVYGAEGQYGLSREFNPNIITGNKGIFPNDGEVAYTLTPFAGYPLASFNEQFITNGIKVTENVDGGSARLATFVAPSVGSPAETNGWTYELQYDNGDPSIYFVFNPNDEASFGVGSDATTLASDPVNWDLGILYYNETNGTLRNDDAGGRTDDTLTAGWAVISGDPEGTSLAIPKTAIAYGRSQLGYVRDQLYKGANNYPGVPDAKITNFRAGGVNGCGFDVMVDINDNTGYTDIAVNVSQLLQKQGTSFPNPGWRENSKLVFPSGTFPNDVAPSQFNQIPGTNPTPTNWNNFTYLEDRIQVKILVSKVRTVSIFISHDKKGDGNWEENTMLLQMNQANNNFSTTIIEDFFPLRPCFTMADGGRYDRKLVIVEGRFDTEEVIRGLGVAYQDEEINDSHPDWTDNTEVQVTAPANAMKLSALFIFGRILDSDLVSNGGTLPDAEVPTANSKIANNIAPLIGFDTFNVYASGNVSNPTTTQHSPILTIREPNLLIELVDFNIKGYNGATGDQGKIIASIPAEEFGTNTRTGTLNYFAQFPIMIDLNLVHDITVYDLNLVIRRPNGQIADDLLPVTNCTLLFKESDETKQRRIMKEQTELIASTLSNMNQNKIDIIGYENPKL